MKKDHEVNGNGLKTKQQFYEIEQEFHDGLASSIQIPNSIKLDDWGRLNMFKGEHGKY